MSSGKGRYEIQTATGVKVWVDRFDTGLVEGFGTYHQMITTAPAPDPTRI